MAARRRLALVVAALALSAGLVRGQTALEIESLDQRGDRPVMLKSFWFGLPDTQTTRPAVVLLHGCGGPYDRQGKLAARLRDYAVWLNAQGMHALVVDSFSARGERELCTQRIGTRAVTQANRRLDALGAVAWLAQRREVDRVRIGLMGWSNGGSTVLAATNRRQRDVAQGAVQPAFAVAFYPGCEAELERGYQTGARLLMLVGEADDWTPAAPCHELARRAAGVKPEIEGYPGAYHGFDSNAPLRLRKEVPNGLNPGQGVHVGGDAQALQRSRDTLRRFLARQ